MRRILAAAMGAAIQLLAGPALARDVALVIGNDGYRNVPPLQKAVNDARAVAGALRGAGFAVTEAEDLDQRAMSRALVDFEADLAAGDRALLYYSGHGVALGGSNYLLPIDVPRAESRQEGLIRDAAFAVDRITDDFRQHGAQVAILVLDACRNDPFATEGTRGLPLTRGLARVEPPDGVFVLMSASPHQEALDRLSDGDRDPNSVFTRVFLRQLVPGRTLVDVAKRTQLGVRALASSIGFAQVPAYSDMVVGDVVLAAGAAGQAAGAAPEATGPEATAAADPQHVSGNVPTRLDTGAHTQFGSGVAAGTGVRIGPGVLIGGKDPRITIEDSPGAPPPPGPVAALQPAPLAGGTTPGAAGVAPSPIFRAPTPAGA